MNIQLRNKWGDYKDTKVGVSWTSLFFGFLTPLIRGDFKFAAIMFLINSLTCGFSRFVFFAIYNKKYIEDLIEKGYLPANEKSQEILQMNGFWFDPVDFEEKEEEKNK